MGAIENLIRLSVLVICHVSMVMGVRAQTFDTMRVPLARDSAWMNGHPGTVPLPPQGIVLGFDHVLSIYEWRGAFDYSVRAPRDANTPLRNAPSPMTDVHLKATSRFLPQDSLATTEALGMISASQPLAAYQPDEPSLAAFLTFFGSSYVTSPRPGTLAALLITKQASGFGVGGMKLDLPDGSLLSLGAGLARETQSAFGAATIGPSNSNSAGLSATGFVLRSDDSATTRPLADGVLASASARVDERFFAERAERFSNDSLRAMLLSGVNDPSGAQNAAHLQLGLLRRDFFFQPDTSATQSIKQERTEYAMALADSLSYPVLDDRVRAHLALELEPRDVIRRSDVPSGSLTSSAFSAFSTLMAPSEITSLRLATEGRLTFGDAVPGTLQRLPGALPADFSGEARMRYEERSETIRLISSEMTGVDETTIKKLSATLDQASYSARTTTAAAVLRYAPSFRDEAEIEATARILSYDTPSDLNDDEHDDLLASMRLKYFHYLTDQLRWEGSVRASREHLVYLKSDRSAQNAVTQSIVFGSLATIASPQIFASAGGEVFANYTVFDYINSLPLLSSIGNYLLRGMTITDTLAVPLGRMAGGAATIEQGVSLRVSERGSFNDQAFTERRDASVTELGASLLFGLASELFGAEPRWNLRLGARAFFLSHSGRGSEALTPGSAPFTELERQSRIGPMLLLSLTRPFATGPTLTGSLWYAVLTTQDFDTQSAAWRVASRSTQLESHLTAAWTF